jgi:hypothetical protein
MAMSVRGAVVARPVGMTALYQAGAHGAELSWFIEDEYVTTHLGDRYVIHVREVGE